MASVGPNSPASVATNAGVGNKSWLSPEFAVSSNNIYADATLPATLDISHDLYAKTFGFTAVPDAAAIVGIVVEIERYASGSNVNDYLSPQLVGAAGTIIGDVKTSAVAWATSDPNSYISYGSSTDLWGTSGLTGADVKDIDFGVIFIASNYASASRNAYVDHIRMTIYYRRGCPEERSRRGPHNKQYRR